MNAGNACPTCKHFACVCEIIKLHEAGCPFRTASSCSVPVECGHGRDTCPKCDACTCKSLEARAQEQRLQNPPRRAA
jgi:hypothetical protein